MCNDQPQGIPPYGFIITRHVRDASTNRYWKHCYEKIREWHGEEVPIVIIDDNSDPSLVDTVFPLTNTTIIQSQFPGRGEWLPYHYFYHRRFFEVAIILHDSVFLNSCVPWERVEECAPLWDFSHTLGHDQLYCLQCLSQLQQPEPLLERFYTPYAWRGVFGGMSVIRHTFLQQLYARHNLDLLPPLITNRAQRMEWERVLGVVFQVNSTKPLAPLYGDILKFCEWGSANFDNMHRFQHLPLIKIWTGR